jgi:hypothetical protein
MTFKYFTNAVEGHVDETIAINTASLMYMSVRLLLQLKMATKKRK